MNNRQNPSLRVVAEYIDQCIQNQANIGSGILPDWILTKPSLGRQNQTTLPNNLHIVSNLVKLLR